MFPSNYTPIEQPFASQFEKHCSFNSLECQENLRDQYPVFLFPLYACQPCLHQAWLHLSCSEPKEFHQQNGQKVEQHHHHHHHELKRQKPGPLFTKKGREHVKRNDEHEHRKKMVTFEKSRPSCPMPVKIKTEKVIDKIMKKREKEEKRKEELRKEKKAKEMKKKGIYTEIGWYSKKYGRGKFNKLRIVTEKLAPEVWFDEKKDAKETIKEQALETVQDQTLESKVEETILHDEIPEPPNSNVLPNLLWTIKDTIPLNPFKLDELPKELPCEPSETLDIGESFTTSDLMRLIADIDAVTSEPLLEPPIKPIQMSSIDPLIDSIPLNLSSDSSSEEATSNSEQVLKKTECQEEISSPNNPIAQPIKEEENSQLTLAPDVMEVSVVEPEKKSDAEKAIRFKNDPLSSDPLDTDRKQTTEDGLEKDKVL